MSQKFTLAQAYNQGLREEMQRNPEIFVLGTDLGERGGHFGQVRGLSHEFGAERVRDTPISEAAMVAAGVGSALAGMRPIVDLNFVDFAFGAMDEIANQAAKIPYMWQVPLPIMIRASVGVALAGEQHNNQIEAWFAHLPGFLVAMASTPWDTKALVKTALRGDDPVIFLMHKRLTGLRGEVGGEEDLLPFGSAAIRRPGNDATVVTYGFMVGEALKAAERLAEDGIDVEVIDLRTIVPLDLETVEESVRKTGRLVVAVEAPSFCSVGAEVAAAVQEGVFNYLDSPVIRVGAPHSPIPHSPPMIAALVPTASDVERAVRGSFDGWPSSLEVA